MRARDLRVVSVSEVLRIIRAVTQQAVYHVVMVQYDDGIVGYMPTTH